MLTAGQRGRPKRFHRPAICGRLSVALAARPASIYRVYGSRKAEVSEGRDDFMAEFSPADAALEGFRLTREHPTGLAIWTVALFVVTMLSSYVLVRTGAADAMAELLEIFTAPSGDPADPATAAAVTAAMQRAVPGMMTILAPAILVQMVIRAAILRVALRPDEQRAYLGLGMDELRIVGAFVLVIALTLLAGFVVGIASMAISLVVPALGVLITFLGSLVIGIFVGTRFLLIYPLAIAERSLRPAEAWRLTNGRFWPAFGAMLMAYVFYFIVLVLGGVIASAIRAVAGIDAEAARLTMETLFHPGEIVAGALTALLQALGLILITAPGAAIYRAIRRTGTAEQF